MSGHWVDNESTLEKLRHDNSQLQGLSLVVPSVTRRLIRHIPFPLSFCCRCVQLSSVFVTQVIGCLDVASTKPLLASQLSSNALRDAILVFAQNEVLDTGEDDGNHQQPNARTASIHSATMCSHSSPQQLSVKTCP